MANYCTSIMRFQHKDLIKIRQLKRKLDRYLRIGEEGSEQALLVNEPNMLEYMTDTSFSPNKIMDDAVTEGFTVGCIWEVEYGDFGVYGDTVIINKLIQKHHKPHYLTDDEWADYKSNNTLNKGKIDEHESD